MKILFLGTAAGWPLPRLGCQCKICSSIDPKDKRLRPSVLINDSLLIDCGPDFYHQILKIKDLRLSSIFISHAHPDHYFGLWDLAKLYHQKPTLYLSSQNQKSILKRINDLTFTFLLKGAKNFQEGEVIKINNLKITPFSVDHSTNTETYGFQVTQKKKSLLYIPDFRKIPIQSKNFLKEATLAVFGGTSLYPAGPKRWGHMPIEKSIPLAKNLKIKTIYYTHIGHGPKSGPHQELENYLLKKGGRNFHIAYDGLELTI